MPSLISLKSLKFRSSEKTTSHLTWKISSIFVAFLEDLNFKKNCSVKSKLLSARYYNFLFREHFSGPRCYIEIENK